jgi:cysteine desulfurase
VPTHYGGSQEIKRRGGTENTVGIAGFGGACGELMLLGTEELRDDFERSLRAGIPELEVNGASRPRLPNTSNLRFPGIAAEVLLSAFDLNGLYVSAGSACSSGSISPSHVLLEMGLSPQEAKECVRFSWGRSTTRETIEKAAEIVVNEVNRIKARRAR